MQGTVPLGSPEEQPDDGSLEPRPMLDSGPQLEDPGSLLPQAARVVVGVAVVGNQARNTGIYRT